MASVPVPVVSLSSRLPSSLPRLLACNESAASHATHYTQAPLLASLAHTGVLPERPLLQQGRMLLLRSSHTVMQAEGGESSLWLL